MSQVNQTIHSVRGMKDWQGSDAAILNAIDNVMQRLFLQAGYQIIRLPVLEKTALFARAVGEVTDIVEKEMYTFTDRNDELLSLRPEATAGLIRSVIENGFWQPGQLLRYQYNGPMFRRERPQQGRYRQFFQSGAEFLGSSSPYVDVELISLVTQWFKEMQLSDEITLNLNSIGKLEERKEFKQALIDYLTPYTNDLDEDSQRRLSTNPLRILDSKNPATQGLLEEAPVMQNFLSAESRQMFDTVQQTLDSLNISYVINHRLVRGLDYYNDTVFEWITDRLGSQGTVCGGGRYDTLVAQLGGKPCPACGFAAGSERILGLYNSVHGDSKGVFADNFSCKIYVVAEPELMNVAMGHTIQLRNHSDFEVISDVQLASLKNQLKKANKSGAEFALIFAEREWQQGDVIIKPLRGQLGDQGAQLAIPVAEMTVVLQQMVAKSKS